MASTSRLQSFTAKPRVFILSDISSNEPSGADSLCRYLLYANQFETEGLVACTSARVKSKVSLEGMEAIVKAYGRVVDNLNTHVHPDWQYPAAEHLGGLIRKGAETYGMTGVGDELPLSNGCELLLERVSAPLLQPLWVLCWGGTNTVAQLLLELDRKHSPEDAARIYSRLRIYAISDRDDSGAWIRTNFPDVFYIASIHGWNMHGLATWTGISGDRFYGFDQGGPDFTKMEKQWINENIQIGPLGKVYPTNPDHLSITEGDTPTFLYLIQNGLGISEFPEYGSWGGRYTKTDINTTGLNGNHYSDAVDRVKGQDGRIYPSNHATIWRWRDAFQNDFAARMQWTVNNDFSGANHHPVISINGSTGIQPVRIQAEVGNTFTLNASNTYDPDSNDTLTFKWWQYKEPTATQWLVDAEVGSLILERLDNEGRIVSVTLPGPASCAVDFTTRKPVANGQLLHLILEVTDNGTPPLTSYRRILFQVTNKMLLGGGQGENV